MTISEAIVNTYGVDALRQIYLKHGEEAASNLIRSAVKRDCPNYTATWGAWKHVMRAVKRKLGTNA